MKSMTGFAQGRYEFNNISLSIIFKSLNHRYLDISFKGTGVNPTTEKIIKDVIKDRIFRGKLEVGFDMFDSNQRKCNIQFNDKLSGEIMDELLFFKRKYKDVSLSLDSLLKIPMIFHLDYLPENFNDYEKGEIKKFIETVFEEFINSRNVEGNAISKDILASIKKIDASLAAVEKEAEKVEQEMFLKLKEKISRFLSELETDDRRIVQEAAILAEKACINEEIKRLSTHNKRLKELINDKNMEIKGREADFLAQEMQRETHTIASKTTSLDIHKDVLNIRREIEKIKQQVQNVE